MGNRTPIFGPVSTAFHDVVWYRRSIAVPAEWRNRRVLLNFGAVDYEATVWVNGEHAGDHTGGHVGFSLDITDHLKPADNVVVVRVFDPGTDRTIPRGKQYWQPASASIFYTRTSGLWQPVWIEAASATRIAAIEARTSCRLKRSPRPFTNGLKIAMSPPAHARNEISFTGATSGGRSHSPS